MNGLRRQPEGFILAGNSVAMKNNSLYKKTINCIAIPAANN